MQNFLILIVTCTSSSTKQEEQYLTWLRLAWHFIRSKNLVSLPTIRKLPQIVVIQQIASTWWIQNYWWQVSISLKALSRNSSIGQDNTTYRRVMEDYLQIDRMLVTRLVILCSPYIFLRLEGCRNDFASSYIFFPVKSMVVLPNSTLDFRLKLADWIPSKAFESLLCHMSSDDEILWYTLISQHKLGVK